MKVKKGTNREGLMHKKISLPTLKLGVLVKVMKIYNMFIWPKPL